MLHLHYTHTHTKNILFYKFNLTDNKIKFVVISNQQKNLVNNSGWQELPPLYSN